MHKFKELIVWQKSRKLVKDVYKTTHNFPKEELFGLTSQIRRSAVSIPTNIAEGCGRSTNKDLCRFLNISNGSAFELETLLILGADLEFISEKQFNILDEKIQEIQKVIYSFKKSKTD